MDGHSIDKSLFKRILNGTKRKKSDNSFISIEVGEFAVAENRCLLLRLHVADGATLKMGLLGHEAIELGGFLLELGAKVAALNEAGCRARYPQEDGDHWGKIIESDGVFRSVIGEVENGA